jgi:hypothetical protein
VATGSGASGGERFGFAGDIARRARWARVRNNGEPEPAWPAGERLAVALVPGDQATLDAEGYTRHEAARRLAGDIAFHGYGADVRVWLDEVRAEPGGAPGAEG